MAENNEFIREVDEDYRRDQIANIWKRYNALIITLAVLLVAGVGGYNYWRHAERTRAEAASVRFDKANRLAKDGKAEEADRDFAAIQAEWGKAGEMLSLITGEPHRLASNAALARSIEHRFPYLDPLNHLQVELMRRYRQQKAGDPANARVQRGIHISINGIAAGLRNTG